MKRFNSWSLTARPAKYDEKEAEYPVMAGMYQFVQQGSTSRIDREGLVQWASRRFENELTIEDFKNMQREEIRELLVGESRNHQKRAQSVISSLQTKVEAPFGKSGAVPLRNGNGEAKSLEDWFKQELNYDLDIDDVNRLEKKLSSNDSKR